MISPALIDHIVILIKDLSVTEKFYSAFLGKPIDQSEYQVAYQVGSTKLFFALPGNESGPVYDKENIGLNHLAFGVTSLEALQQFAEQLTAAGIAHSGIQIDKYGGKEFIWFDDPDNIRLEFYLRT